MANNFLPFCPTDSGTNLLTQSAYAAASDRTNGNQPGVASSKLINKAIRQSAYVTSQYAQFLADTLGADVLDDATPAKLLAQINALFLPHAPVLTRLTSGSGTWLKTFVFGIASGNATAGATYTNNAFTFTVKTTVAAGVLLECTGTGAPTVNGTLTKSGGTGDATITFYSVKSALYLRVKAAGGGGGGVGSGTTLGLAASAGGNTTFGSTLVVANGGLGGSNTGSGAGGDGGDGGTASIGAGVAGIAMHGQAGGGSQYNNAIAAHIFGGPGGATPFGGGGAVTNNTTGGAGQTNTGSGGAGAAISVLNGISGSGGGAGGYVDALIYSPAASYGYAVGALGAASTAGVGGGFNGGDGAAGQIIVEEYFQ